MRSYKVKTCVFAETRTDVIYNCVSYFLYFSCIVSYSVKLFCQCRISVGITSSCVFDLGISNSEVKIYFVHGKGNFYLG